MSKNIEHQYLKLLQDILDTGVVKEDRTGTGTISVFGRQIRHKMPEGFPLLTTKKMYWKGIVGELLWFLRGSTDIRDLWRNDIKIWDGDWYKKYEKSCSSPYTLEEIKQKVIKGAHAFHDSMFDLGPIYGKQWRRWTKKKMYLSTDGSYEKIFDEVDQTVIDQISILINELKTNPDSRRLMVNSWNVGELDEMVLPPCHFSFQCYSHEKDGKRYLSLAWNQRSCDVGLGIPFNIASYGLLLEIIAKEVGMIPYELIGNLGDCHIYKNHIEGVKEQLIREPFKLPSICLDYREGEYSKDLTDLTLDDFVLFNYQSHPAIKLPLSN